MSNHIKMSSQSHSGTIVTQQIHSRENLLIPLLAIVAAVILWGGSFASMRVAVSILNPWTVMWFRMTIAALLILPFLPRLKPDQYIKGDWKLLLPMVLFQPCLYFLLESYALKFTTSSQAGVIAATLPLMVAAGAWLMLGESINLFTLLGLVLSIAGVIALTLLGEGNEATNPVMGNFIEFIAMASASANMVLIKKLCERYNSWTLTAIQVMTGAVFFLPGLIILLQSPPPTWSLQLVLILIFLGSFVTLGAFGLYNWGISQISATKASAFINLVPVFAVIFGWVLLNETLTVFQMFAACCVITGVWVSQIRTAATESISHS